MTYLYRGIHFMRASKYKRNMRENLFQIIVHSDNIFE